MKRLLRESAPCAAHAVQGAVHAVLLRRLWALGHVLAGPGAAGGLPHAARHVKWRLCGAWLLLQWEERAA